MATFNNIDDLLRILDENPDLLDAVRARVLTRELLELPETVARLTVRVDQLSERMDQLTVRMDQLAERMDQLTVRMDQLAERMDQLTVRMDQFAERMQSDMGALRTQMGDIRGRIVYDIVRQEAALLADDLGLRYVRTVNPLELRNMTRDADTKTIEPRDLRSFHRADLVFQASNGNDETVYVAVEASYTVNGRDTYRAIRNSQFLTRFTGVAGVPAVAGVVIDRHIQDSVNSGEIFWYEIPMGDLRPE